MQAAFSQLIELSLSTTQQVWAQSRLFNILVTTSLVDPTAIKNLTCSLALKSELLVLDLLELETTNSDMAAKY